MNETTIIVHFLLWTFLAGLLGAFTMTVVMRVMAGAGLSKGNMVVAIGSFFTGSSQTAFLLGSLLHGISGVCFAMLYAVLMKFLELNYWPAAFFAGAGFGLFHGIVVSLTLVWMVAEHHPMEEYKNAGIAVGLCHLAGHVAYGMVVGLIIGIAQV
ncbi:MAG TPA: hypothetical protein VKC60_16350 [Opitutaceae bacterium]|nr:hypothetical protein [Opitutaceae bacterium]